MLFQTLAQQCRNIPECLRVCILFRRRTRFSHLRLHVRLSRRARLCRLPPVAPGRTAVRIHYDPRFFPQAKIPLAAPPLRNRGKLAPRSRLRRIRHRIRRRHVHHKGNLPRLLPFSCVLHPIAHRHFLILNGVIDSAVRTDHLFQVRADQHHPETIRRFRHNKPSSALRRLFDNRCF